MPNWTIVARGQIITVPRDAAPHTGRLKRIAIELSLGRRTIAIRALGESANLDLHSHSHYESGDGEKHTCDKTEEEGS